MRARRRGSTGIGRSLIQRWHARSHGSSRRSCCNSLARSPAARTPGTPLGDAILLDPRVAGRICIGDILPVEPRARLVTAISDYAGTRTATAEIATGSIAAGIGALWVKHATPGMVTLGSVVANMVAQQAAIAAFPLGAGLGIWWYGMYPVAPSAELWATTTGAFAVVGALFAIFSGIVTDPVQRFIGLHQRRLLRLIGALEDVLCGDGEGRFPLRDHYVARLIDLLDLSAALLRTVRA